MTFSKLWARITGADKKKKFPNQQVSALGRIGDQTIVFPYCLFVDLPNDALLKEIAPGAFVPVTVDRPNDSERSEPVFFHPATNSRIIMRNNGDIDIEAGSGNVNITAALTKVTGDFEVTGDTALAGAVTNGGQDIGGTHTHGGVTTGVGTSGAPNS